MDQMATTCSTARESSIHNTSDHTFRRHSIFPRKPASQNSPKPGTGLTTGNDAVPNAVGPPSRRASMLSVPRRRLPWLDGKNLSGRGDSKRNTHVPGAFIISDDDDTSSTRSSNAPPSASQPGRHSAIPTAALDVPKNTSSAYSPSIYSTGAGSGVSVGPTIQSPRSYRSYEALLSSPDRSETASNEARSDLQHPQRKRRRSSHMGDSTVSTPTLESPLTAKGVTSVPLSPKQVGHPEQDSDRNPSTTEAETELKRAITGMEGLMQKALELANGGAYHKTSDSVSDVLEGASKSLTETPSLSSRMDPLLVSDSLDASSDHSPTDSGTSISPRSSPSFHTALTSTTNLPEIASAVSPTRGTKSVSFQSDSSSSSSSIALTPKQFYERKSADSIVTDWAYVNAKTPTHPTGQPASSSSSSISTPTDLERQKSSHWRAWHDNTNPPVYHDNRRFRRRGKAPTKSEVHDHIKHYGVPPTPVRSSSLRHRDVDGPAHNRYGNSDHTRQIRDRRKEHRSERNERYGAVRRRKPHNPWDDINNTPSKGLGMGTPARTHVSYSGSKGMELFKRQRRQPIARNWGTTKKRITATIACINTALVGFLIGVYVSICQLLVSHVLIWNRLVRFLESSTPLQIRDILLSWEMSCESHLNVV